MDMMWYSVREIARGGCTDNVLDFLVLLSISLVSQSLICVLYCTLNKQYKEICSLKDTVETLTNRIVELESACKSNVSQPAAAQVMQTQSSVNSTPATNKQVTDKSTIPPKPPQLTPEKKFNLIFYGITESPVNTPRTNRQQHDLQNILSTLSIIDSLTSSLIKDFHRLGKFSASKPSP